MMLNRNTFSKKEHLCNEIDIETLYAEGTSIFLFPYRCVFRLVTTEELPVRCMVSASKKRFKHAVDRNRLKRQMREAYRINKHSLYNMLNKNENHIHLAIQYVGNRVEPSTFTQKKMIQLLRKLEKELASQLEHE